MYCNLNLKMENDFHFNKFEFECFWHFFWVIFFSKTTRAHILSHVTDLEFESLKYCEALWNERLNHSRKVLQSIVSKSRANTFSRRRVIRWKIVQRQHLATWNQKMPPVTQNLCHPAKRKFLSVVKQSASFLFFHFFFRNTIFQNYQQVPFVNLSRFWRLKINKIMMREKNWKKKVKQRLTMPSICNTFLFLFVPEEDNSTPCDP